MELSYVLLRPVVSEKSTRESEQGKYTFHVHGSATKIDIKNAVRVLYGAPVRHVTLHWLPCKKRLVGRGKTFTKRDKTKKATVTLEKGKTLDLYKFTSGKAEKKEAPGKVKNTKTAKEKAVA